MNKKGYLAGGFPIFVAMFLLFPFFAFAQTFSISPDPVVPVDGGTVVNINADVNGNQIYIFDPDGNYFSDVQQGLTSGRWDLLFNYPPILEGTYNVLYVDIGDDGSCQGTITDCEASAFYISTLGIFTVGAGGVIYSNADALGSLGTAFTTIGTVLGVSIGAVLVTLIALLGLGYGLGGLSEYLFGGTDWEKENRRKRENAANGW